MADKGNGHIKTSLGSQDFTITSGKDSDSIPKTNHALFTKWRQNKERQGTMSNKLEMTVYTNCTSFLFKKNYSISLWILNVQKQVLL